MGTSRVSSHSVLPLLFGEQVCSLVRKLCLSDCTCQALHRFVIRDHSCFILCSGSSGVTQEGLEIGHLMSLGVIAIGKAGFVSVEAYT